MTHTCTSTYATTTNTSPLIGRLGAARCCSAAARHDTSSRPPTVLCVTTAGVSDLTPRDLSGWVMCVRRKGAEHLTSRLGHAAEHAWVDRNVRAETVTVFSVWCGTIKEDRLIVRSDVAIDMSNQRGDLTGEPRHDHCDWGSQEAPCPRSKDLLL